MLDTLAPPRVTAPANASFETATTSASSRSKKMCRLVTDANLAGRSATGLPRSPTSRRRSASGSASTLSNVKAWRFAKILTVVGALSGGASMVMADRRTASRKGVWMMSVASTSDVTVLVRSPALRGEGL